MHIIISIYHAPTQYIYLSVFLLRRWCFILTSRPHGTHCESASHASAEHNVHVPLSRISWWPDLVIVHQLQSTDTAAGDTRQQYAGTGEWERLRPQSRFGVGAGWACNSLHKCIKCMLVDWGVGGRNVKWASGWADECCRSWSIRVVCIVCLNASRSMPVADSLGYCLDFYICY